MKEIKFLLYTLAVAAYTSLWWGVCVFQGITIKSCTPPTPNCPVGIIVLIMATVLNILLCSRYVLTHWDDNSKSIKEIKFIIYTIGVAAYTSLCWATCIFDGIQVGPNNVALGAIGLLGSTLAILILIVSYIKDHWDDK